MCRKRKILKIILNHKYSRRMADIQDYILGIVLNDIARWRTIKCNFFNVTCIIFTFLLFHSFFYKFYRNTRFVYVFERNIGAFIPVHSYVFLPRN